MRRAHSIQKSLHRSMALYTWQNDQGTSILSRITGAIEQRIWDAVHISSRKSMVSPNNALLCTFGTIQSLEWRLVHVPYYISPP